ncbi:MAG TPA: DUF4384 domain-containing protein [Gemmatimonadales bacterium]|nr:DUF4384 domain-containing protein [Gemmatimonadales bacterium]
MFLSFALIALLAPSPSSAVQDPAVRITLNEAGRYERGDYAKVKVRVEDDGYLVVLHADPDGRVRVLYPIDPDDDTWVRGRRSYELRDRGGDDRLFMVEDESGRGVVLAAVSRDPFRFGEFSLNRHWDFDALNARDARGDEEAVLTGIASRMAQGGYDYDLATYIVNDYVDVAYAPVSYVSPVYYHDSYCGSRYFYYSYSCDPYYYNRYRGSSISIHIGDYYDPFGYGYYPYYGYRPAYYYPYYNYPRYPRYYGYRPGDYYGGTYRPRYTTPSQFKQDNRRWDGLAYRDRSAASVQAVNTVYNPAAPARRAVTNGDPGRSPLVNTQVGDRNLEASPRRASSSSAPAQAEQPRERRRVESRAAEPAPATPRRVEPSSNERIRSRESVPSRKVESQRPEPTIERAEPGRAEPRRVEPSRAEPSSRAEPRRVEPNRAEPSRRAAEPSSRAEPSRSSAGRSAPSPSRAASPSRSSSSGRSAAPARSSGGGGRRGPR